MLTDEKGYYGLIPAVARKSDVCVVLPGAWSTFCLRQTETVRNYKLLGDAYFSNHETLHHEEGVPVYETLDITTLVAQSSFKEHTITLI